MNHAFTSLNLMVFLSFCLQALYSSTKVESSEVEPLGDDVSMASNSLTLDVITND